jgi:hypothetical protein
VCFLISNIYHVLNVVFFLLSYSSVFEFYFPTFRNTAFSVFVGGVNKKKEQTECSESWEIKFEHRGITQKKEYIETVFVLACVCSSHDEQ